MAEDWDAHEKAQRRAAEQAEAKRIRDRNAAETAKIRKRTDEELKALKQAAKEEADRRMRERHKRG
jgi:hypothetical protein